VEQDTENWGPKKRPKKFWSCSPLIRFAPNPFKNGGRRHLGFLHYVNFYGKSGCETLFSVSVSNSVQMFAIVAKLWPKM